MTTDLSDFGIGSSPTPPIVERERIEQSPHTGKIAGFIGTAVNREARVYTTLRSDKHYYVKGRGYAISDSVLDNLSHYGVTIILIHEGTENDDVYEFTTADYTSRGTPVPVDDLQYRDDTQTYVPLRKCRHKWLGHAGDMFARDFYDACEYIDWKGYDPELKQEHDG